MNKAGALVIIIISFFLLASLKSSELSQLQVFRKANPSIKLTNFESAKQNLSTKDQELLELWESVLTGRTAPVAKWMRNQYKELGLSHLFTPSGFHLSAVLMPVMKIVQPKKWQLIIILILGVFIYFLPGQVALKRMILIKFKQKLLGQKIGFLLAILLDILLGSFQHSALSFSYSFLFLGIIYFRQKNLILWFFFAQLLIAYFNGNYISPLILILSPIINFSFGLAMPLLFCLAIPLWEPQRWLGLRLLEFLQWQVNLAAHITSLFPCWEVNAAILVACIFFYFKKKIPLIISMLFFCNSLNMDLQRPPTMATFEYVPQGEARSVVQKQNYLLVNFDDGKCKRQLIRGHWWERCSPRRESNKKSIRKLSYL
jgi:hypothetical protein